MFVRLIFNTLFQNQNFFLGHTDKFKTVELIIYSMIENNYQSVNSN